MNNVFILERYLHCITFDMVNIWREVEVCGKTLTADPMQSKKETLIMNI